jgi:hypothetical protein
MFLGIVLHGSKAEKQATPPINYHLEKLTETSRAGPFEELTLSNGKVIWDGQSNHFKYSKSPSGPSHIFLGGYLSVVDEWTGTETNTIEDVNAWGEFAAIIATDTGDKISARVFSDLSGSWPIYFAQQGDRFCASNDPQFVAVAMGFTELEPQAVYELISFGHTLGGSSTISGVCKLPSGQRLSVEFIEGKELRVNLVDYGATNQYRSSRLPSQNAFDVLVQSIRDSHFLASGMGEAVVQISGGLDSRLTAAAMRTACEIQPKSALTFNLSNAEEIQVARQVAATLGFDHEVLNLDSNYYQGILRDAWLLTGGQVSVYASAGNILGLPSPTEKRDFKVIGGWPGDCLIGSYVTNSPLLTRSSLTRFGVYRWASMRSTELMELGITIQPQRSSRNLARQARRILIDSTLRASGESAGAKISHWAMFSRQPSFSYISPTVLMSRVLSITPLLSRPWLVELLSLKIDDLVDKNFYRSLFASSLPELAKIKYANSNLNLTAGYSSRRWIPKKLVEVAYLLPSWVTAILKKARQSLKIISKRLDSASSTGISAEEEFWSEKFQNESFGSRLLAGETVFELKANASLHATSCFIALKMTARHLVEAKMLRELD